MDIGYEGVMLRLRKNICRSLIAEPCSYNQLVARAFLTNVGSLGVKMAFQDLVNKKIVSEDGKGIITVNEQYVKQYSEPVENIWK